jgi:hypothetical protein
MPIRKRDQYIRKQLDGSDEFEISGIYGLMIVDLVIERQTIVMQSKI